MIRQAAMQEWERTNAPGQKIIPEKQKYPFADPNWDNKPQHRNHMGDLRDIIIMGIKEARIREYLGMNPEDPVAQGLLKVDFVTKAWPDIQKSSRRWKDGANSHWRPSCGRPRRCLSGG